MKAQRVPVKNIENLDSFALGPIFERFLILGGPRERDSAEKIQNLDSIHLRHGSIGLILCMSSGSVM